MYSYIVLSLFIVLIALLIWNRVERQWISLSILAISIAIGIVSPIEVINYIDWDIFGLILGMSFMTLYLEKSGLMDIISQHLLKISRGRFTTIFLLSLIAGLVSTILENVSVVFLMAPIVFRVSSRLGLSPVAPMILMTLSANIAGSATMVGDPPAIITAGAFKLKFIDFFVYNGKPSMFFFTISSMVAATAVASLIAERCSANVNISIASKDNEIFYRVDKMFLFESIVFLAIKIVLLSIRNIIYIPLSLTAAIAVGGLTAIRIMHRDIDTVKNIAMAGFEWKLLAFLSGIFVLSGAFEKYGLTKEFGRTIIDISHGNLFVVTTILIWLSVAFSAFIDNVPYIVTMIPVVKEIASLLSLDPIPLAWALLIGTTLGGNFTYIGASANVTAVRILEKNGYNISFVDFIRYSLIYNTVSVILGWILYELLYVF